MYEPWHIFAVYWLYMMLHQSLRQLKSRCSTGKTFAAHSEESLQKKCGVINTALSSLMTTMPGACALR